MNAFSHNIPNDSTYAILPLNLDLCELYLPGVVFFPSFW